MFLGRAASASVQLAQFHGNPDFVPSFPASSTQFANRERPQWKISGEASTGTGLGFLGAVRKFLGYKESGSECLSETGLVLRLQPSYESRYRTIIWQKWVYDTYINLTKELADLEAT